VIITIVLLILGVPLLVFTALHVYASWSMRNIGKPSTLVPEAVHQPGRRAPGRHAGNEP
jgi:hypothetical protein